MYMLVIRGHAVECEKSSFGTAIPGDVRQVEVDEPATTGRKGECAGERTPLWRARTNASKVKLVDCYHTPSRQFRWLAQPRLQGLFVREILVFLLFKGK